MKNKLRDIIEFADSTFDVAGATEIPGYGALLVLGLESTPERNLDDFRRLDGEFKLFGFQEYIYPRLKSLISFAKDNGFTAEPVGRYGYPPRGEINLKQLAIQIGLGKRGKNTLVLHPKYGTRLRFVAVKIDASLELSISPFQTEPKSELCQDCTLCIDACPVKILKPYQITNVSRCLSNVALMEEQYGALIPCDLCVTACPATI